MEKYSIEEDEVVPHASAGVGAVDSTASERARAAAAVVYTAGRPFVDSSPLAIAPLRFSVFSIYIFLLHFPNDRGKLPGISDGADVSVDQRPRLDKNKTTHHRDRIESMISHKRVEYIYGS